MYSRFVEFRNHIKKNKLDDIVAMLEKSPGLVNYNYIDERQIMTGKTPLFMAVERCIEFDYGLDVIHLLLLRGADPNKDCFYEGQECSPMYLCSTVPKRLCAKAMAIAEALVEHGINVKSFSLLPRTVERMISFPDDYDETMIKFVCRNGALQQEINLCLVRLVSVYFDWAPAIVSCLLEEGAFIYSLNENNYSPAVLAGYYNSKTSLQIRSLDRTIKLVKNLIDFERVVHAEPELDEHVNQWSGYVLRFDQTVRRILTNERNALHALTRGSAAVLPKEVALVVFSYVTNTKAVSRARKWSKCF
jgi:hypothetical protein